VNRVHELVDRERHRSTVDHGHRPRKGSLENGRNGVPRHGTSPRLRKNGKGTEVSLTGAGGGGGGSDTTGHGPSGPSGPSARAVVCGRSSQIGQVFRPNRTSFEVEKIDK
jgi:hypothetical protein